MPNFLYFLYFIPVIVLIILVHELGHFITARASGVRVHEFGFGYPPRLLAVKRGETEYSLNLLPLGGFVRLAGEVDPQEPGSLASKSIGTRVLVFSAGSLMNALLPILLFTASFAIPSEMVQGQVQVVQVVPGSPAEKAGLRAGDVILKVNDRQILNQRDLLYNINLNLGSEISLVVRRGRFDQEVFRVVPRWNPPQGQGPTGIVIGMANAYVTTQAYPVWEALPLGVRASLDTLTLAKNEIMGWFVRRIVPQVAGPVGIAQLTGEVAQVGLGPLLGLTALISMNLAVINLLPIPMLDGGRIFFVLLEFVRRGKRIPPEREGLIHLIGFAFLLALMAIVTFFDILRIVQGESLF